jgi:hypothetical protein
MERSGSKGTLVHFRCTNPAHARPAKERSDTLTLFEALWAYCPFDVRAGDHDWAPTGGVTMAALRNEDVGQGLFGQPAEEDPRGRKQADPESG